MVVLFGSSCYWLVVVGVLVGACYVIDLDFGKRESLHIVCEGG